ncbi:MAG: transglycosylase domain-containing protein [Bacteroidales bacterium]|nr:transglycosylase domain-containing protein [Bacteroidales bacterium]MCF8402505.1 transglycosylase domain-containing protein [Bacteroidales bacterium]
MLAVILLFTLISQGRLGYIPTFEELENPKSNLASEVYSSDGYLLGKYFIENRSDATYGELDTNLIAALIATEDIRFFSHSGIDFKALGRAVAGALMGQNKGGGSTITQQFSKLLFHEVPNSKTRRVLQKLNEWVIATKLEQRYSKEEIITLYLNKFDFVNNAVGIKSAAKIYFNVTPDSLKIEQSAMLIGMLKNSALYNPVRRPELVQERRNVVLNQMVKYGFLEEEACDSIKLIPVDMSNFKRQSHLTGQATYFREYLRGKLKQWCATHIKADGNPYDLYKDGLKIFTTIDSRMQQYAEEAVVDHLSKDLQPTFYKHWKGHTNAPFYFEKNAKEEIKKILNAAMRRSERYRKLKAHNVPADSIILSFNTPAPMTIFSWAGEIDTVMTPMDSIHYYKFFLQAGLMSMEPQTGYVKAYVGGIDYKHFQYDHVTQGARQVGSTFKPFLYTLAMQNGLSPCSKFANIQPIIYLDNGDTWEPRNSGSDDIGTEITLQYALATSNNWISGWLIKRFSPQSVVKIARNMGVTGFLDPVPAIVLGSSDISLYEMVGAMNCYANKGVHIEPIFIMRIEDKNGNVIESFVPETREAMSEETAYLMLNLMKGVVSYGTGIRLRLTYKFDNPIAGKTGTTNNHSDGWFMGLTPELSTGVWVGCEDRSAHFRTLYLGQGANMALPIWALYMKKIYADSTINISMGDFEPPLEPLSVEIDCDKFKDDNNTKTVVDDDDF